MLVNQVYVIIRFLKLDPQNQPTKVIKIHQIIKLFLRSLS